MELLTKPSLYATEFRRNRPGPNYLDQYNCALPGRARKGDYNRTPCPLTKRVWNKIVSDCPDVNTGNYGTSDPAWRACNADKKHSFRYLVGKKAELYDGLTGRELADQLLNDKLSDDMLEGLYNTRPNVYRAGMRAAGKGIKNGYIDLAEWTPKAKARAINSTERWGRTTPAKRMYTNRKTGKITKQKYWAWADGDAPIRSFDQQMVTRWRQAGGKDLKPYHEYYAEITGNYPKSYVKKMRRLGQIAKYERGSSMKTEEL